MPITFTEEDLKIKNYPHNDAMAIEANIAGWTIGKMLVDTGNSGDIIFASTLRNMTNIDPTDTPLTGFGGKRTKALGKITLPVSLNVRTEQITFDVVEMNFDDNVIFGKGVINAFDVVIRQSFLREILRRLIWQGNLMCTCSKRGLSQQAMRKDPEYPGDTLPRDNEKKRMIEVAPTKKVQLEDDVFDRVVTIGADLEPTEESRLMEFLHNNKDVFAWSANDLKGVDRAIIEHRLDIDLKTKPKKQ